MDVPKANGVCAGKEIPALLPNTALPIPVPRCGELELKDAAEEADGNEKPEKGVAALLLPNEGTLVFPKPNDDSAGATNCVVVAVKAQKAGEN